MAETELRPVTEPEEVEEEQEANSWNPTTWNLKKILAYNTNRVVRIKDVRLGGLYWFFVTCIIMYSIIFVFIMEGRHTEQATGVGTAITKFRGKGFAGDKVFDGPDLRFPVIEPSGAFIMTRRIRQKEQRFGSCVNWDSPRKCPCKANSTCTADGYCAVKGWCPSIGDSNFQDPPPSAVDEVIEGLEDSVLDIASAIRFPSIGNQFFVTGTDPTKTNPFKNIRLRNLLAMAGQKMEDVQRRGALISVNLMWQCDVVVDEYCEPTVVVKRLDNGQGFVQKRAHVRRDSNGEEVRDAVYSFGLRILVDCSGVGRKTSLPLIVVQIGSCISLLRVVMMLVDFIMLKLYPNEDRREAYLNCKVKPTDDYSDLQERLNLIKDEISKDEQQKNMATGTTRSGNNVPLGLGAGGRAGMAQTLLRGRSPRGVHAA